MWVIRDRTQQFRKGNRRRRRRRYRRGVGESRGKSLQQGEEKRKEECKDHTSSLARALGRTMGPQDVALEHIRAGFRQGYGGTSDLDGIEILVLVGRQGRVQVRHQRRDGYLVASGIGGLEQVANGFVDEGGADTGDNQSPVLRPELCHGFSLTDLQQSSVRLRHSDGSPVLRHRCDHYGHVTS